MVTVPCGSCSKPTTRPESHAARVAQVFCSRKCRAEVQGHKITAHAHKGRAKWTAASLASFRAKVSGPNNRAWKGGVTLRNRHGLYAPVKYVRCPIDLLPMARRDGYIMEHRLIAARLMGRVLLRAEVVHHVNHDPTDNRQANLAVFANNRDHKLFEAHGSPSPIWLGSSPSTTAAPSGA